MRSQGGDLRAAESRLLEQFGLTAGERMLTVPAGAPGTVTVRVLDTGGAGDEPPVLFLHGIASASAAAFPLMQELAGRRILALDWPGHGLSGECVLPSGADIREHVLAVLRGVLGELDLPVVDLAGRRPGFAPSVASFFRCLATPLGVRARVTIRPADLAAIRCPVLLIWGDSDVFLTPAAAARTIAAIPDATLVTVSGGHAPWLDAPGECGTALSDFSL